MTGRFGPDKRLTTWIVLGGAALLVAVAATLAAGLLRQIPTGDATSSSPSPASDRSGQPSPSLASSEPSPTSSPLVTPTPIEPPVARYGPFAAIVLVDSLRVRSQPGLSGPPIGAFQVDDVVQIVDGPVVADGDEWFSVQGRANLSGWVSAGPAADPYLDLRSHVLSNIPGTIWGVAAGANGFLAWGWETRQSDEPAHPVLLASVGGGGGWQRASLPAVDAANIVDAAWGSSGWILITADSNWTAAGTFWQSNDGVSWTRLPVLDKPGIVPGSIVASTTGYLMTVVDSRSGSWYGSYFSANGQAWRASGFPVGSSENVTGWGVGAVPQGFLLWVTDVPGTRLFFTTDGRDWVTTGPSLPGSANTPPLFAVGGNRMVAVMTDFTNGAQSIWRTSLPGPTASWTRETVAEATMADTTMVALVSDGSTFLLSGYDRSDATPRVWRSTDGESWAVVPGEELFGGTMPSAVAASTAGFVGIGRVTTAAGLNSVMWQSANGLDWNSEADPVLGLLHSAVVGTCPALPETHLEWLAVPAPVAAECLGDTPITFSGWLTEGGGCGGFTPGTFEPEWLASMFATYPVLVTPFEAEYGGCGSAARHPSLLSIPDKQQWVTITGHYDDPAAGTCHWLPDPMYVNAVLIDQAYQVQRCRWVFVATAVVPLSR